jgi:dipeptidyl-peptidase-4
VKLTDDGINGMVFNGIADWVYEEEVLSTAQALWFNEDGTALGYAQFNDTEVPLMEFPIYGPLTDDNLYPEIYQLHYPKCGTANPTVSLFAINLDALKQKNEVLASRMRVPRQFQGTDHYFTLATWQPNAGGGKFMVVWMNRNQNVSLYTLCAGSYGEDWNCEIQHTDSVQGKFKEHTPILSVWVTDYNLYKCDLMDVWWQ